MQAIPVNNKVPAAAYIMVKTFNGDLFIHPPSLLLVSFRLCICKVRQSSSKKHITIICKRSCMN